MSTPNVKEAVREKYGEAALRVKSGAGSPCCRDERSALVGSCDPITSNLCDAAQEGEVPDTAIKASLGCGNPTALAECRSCGPCQTGLVDGYSKIFGETKNIGYTSPLNGIRSSCRFCRTERRSQLHPS